MAISRERAQRLADLVPHYLEDEYTNLIALLADAMHWCGRKRVSFVQGSETAARHDREDVQQERNERR